MEVKMTVQEVLNLNNAVIDAWNSHDAEKFLVLCDSNIVWQDSGAPDPFKGKDGAKMFYNMWNTAFPDFKIRLVSTIANETGAACEIEFSGSNTGPLRMPGQPEIPTTGKKITASKGTYFATMKNGKVTAVNTYPDMINMMMQLGLMQEQHA